MEEKLAYNVGSYSVVELSPRCWAVKDAAGKSIIAKPSLLEGLAFINERITNNMGKHGNVEVVDMAKCDCSAVFYDISPEDALISSYILDHYPHLLADEATRNEVRQDIRIGETTMSIGDYVCLKDQSRRRF